MNYLKDSLEPLAKVDDCFSNEEKKDEEEKLANAPTKRSHTKSHDFVTQPSMNLKGIVDHRKIQLFKEGHVCGWNVPITIGGSYVAQKLALINGNESNFLVTFTCKDIIIETSRGLKKSNVKGKHL
jgi:hypothetical protein